MKKEQANEIKIRKPSFWFYTVPAYVMRVFGRLYWGMKTDNSEIKKLKGPLLAIAPHASTLDVVPALCTLLPHKFNIVTAKDLFTWKQLKPFIHRFGAIPMSQCGMDLAAIRLMDAAVGQGRNVLLFPEGRTSMDGKQMYYLNPAVGKLVKMLKCPVVLIQTHGVYVTKPRYIKGFRRGKIESKASLLITAEELEKISPSEIYERIREGLKYNDNVWQQENGVRFKAKELASNLNYILYKCPRCGSEYRMTAKADELKCEECGNTVKYTADGRLVPVGDGISLDRIDLWVDYERESVAEELGQEGFRLEKPVDMLVRDDGKHEYVRLGEGELFIDREKIGYVGTRDGAEWRAELALEKMPTIVTKNAEGVDLIIEGKTYRFLFKEHKYSAKYGIIVETLFALGHGMNAKGERIDG